MYKRFKWDLEVRFDIFELDKITYIKKSSKIFVCSTHDIMGAWIPYGWIQLIIDTCRRIDRHQYFFLTKNPSRYRDFEWPNNCKLGVTITDNNHIPIVDYCKIDFVSFEPLLGKITTFPTVKWYIIGGLTPKPVHEKEWVDRIIERADKMNIPVFIKKNAHYPITREEIL